MITSWQSIFEWPVFIEQGLYRFRYSPCSLLSLEGNCNTHCHSDDRREEESLSERTFCRRFLTLGLRPRFGMTLWKGAKVNRGRDYVPGFYEILAFARNDMSREIPRRACALARNDKIRNDTGRKSIKSKRGAEIRTSLYRTPTPPLADSE